MKVCTKCSAVKPFEAFHKSAGAKDGRQSSCKECRSLASQRLYAAGGPEKARARKQAEEARRLAEQCKPCTTCSAIKPFEAFYKKTATKDGLTTACKVCLSLSGRLGYAANAESVLQKQRDARAANPERCREATKRWAAANPGHGTARIAKRRAAKLQRTPSWSETEAIEQFYINRPEDHHGDHIIPLQGELVSGLHVIANLQYLTPEENIRKGNSFNPDDWYWVK